MVKNPTKTTTREAATKTLRQRYSEKLAVMQKRLPPRAYTDMQGSWQFRLTDAWREAEGWERAEIWASETDPTKIAAWKPKDAADLARGPMQSLGMVGWEQFGPSPLRDAEHALADVAKELANAAVTLRLADYAKDLRKWERELRASNGVPSRGPTLMLEEGSIPAIVENVLVADEAERRVSVSEAIQGVPELGLPGTAKSTLYEWMGDEQTACVLGVDPLAARRTQRPLVSGLLLLQKAKSKNRPPSPRKSKSRRN